MRSLLTILVLMMAGCASLSPTATTTATPAASPTPAPEATSLQAKAIADLTQAAADAKAATDPMAPVRLACWNFLLANMPTIPTISVQHDTPTAGLFDAFERGAEVVENVSTLADYQVPAALKVGLAVNCGPIRSRFDELLVQWNLKAVSAAGSVGFILK